MGSLVPVKRIQCLEATRKQASSSTSSERCPNPFSWLQWRSTMMSFSHWLAVGTKFIWLRAAISWNSMTTIQFRWRRATSIAFWSRSRRTGPKEAQTTTQKVQDHTLSSELYLRERLLGSLISPAARGIGKVVPANKQTTSIRVCWLLVGALLPLDKRELHTSHSDNLD